MYCGLVYILLLFIFVTSIFTVLSVNPIHSILFLIATFINSALLLIILGLDFLGLSLIIIYIGAVAILFLFIIMLISFKEVEFTENIFRYLPFGLLILYNLYINFYKNIQTFKENRININYNDWTVISNNIVIKKIGAIMYTEHMVSFILIGVILLVSILIVIYLSNIKSKVKNQDLFNQIYH